MNKTSMNGSEPVAWPLSQFGIEPDTGEDAGPAMRRAIEAAARAEGSVALTMKPGRYDFYPDTATRERYWITNSASEEENPDPTRTIAIHMNNVRNLTLDGGGALLVFHGKMTMLALDGCEHVTIQNIHLDYAWPTVAEMTVEAVSDTGLDVRVHPHSRYEIRDGKLEWIGDGWRFRDGPMQICDMADGTTWRVDNFVSQAACAEELRPGTIRLHIGRRPEASVGQVLQMRDGIRDQVGVFIHRSRNVRIANTGIHFMHGLGIVGQFSEHLSFRQLDLSPRPETGRTVAAFADFVHLSGCKGLVSVTDSRFAGAHDDAINVHGTHLRIVGFPSDKQVLVRFMHPQTYGFAAFHAGDEIEWVKTRSLQAAGSGKVAAAQLIEPRVMLLTMEEPWPRGIVEGDVVENVTWTPEVEIAGNHFARIPTRGVLATTRRRTVIRNNVFERMQMSAVLVADDAASWYESGRVADMRISGNRFIACGSREQAVIAIAPENEELSEETPVHDRIRIEDNVFELSEGVRALEARSVSNLAFRRNSLVAPPGSGPAADVRDAIRLTACRAAAMVDNSLESIE